MWLFNYCLAIASSIPYEIFRNFIFPIENIAALVYVIMERVIIIIMNMGTIVFGHKHVWAQSCAGTGV